MSKRTIKTAFPGLSDADDELQIKTAKLEHKELQVETANLELSETDWDTDINMAVRINPPDMKSAKNYECYKNELLLWQSLTSLEKPKQAGCVALNLPNDCHFAKDIRTKVMEKLSVTELMTETGMEKLISTLDEELLRPEIEQAVEDWDTLENRFKVDSESIDEFINDFDRLYSKVENKGAKLPPMIKTFMMLKRIKLSHEERLIVLSKLDFDSKDNLYVDVKKCLKLLKGKPMSQSQSLEPSVNVHEAHFTQKGRGWGKAKWNNRGGGTSGGKQWAEKGGSGTSSQWPDQRGRGGYKNRGSDTSDRKRSNSGSSNRGRLEKRINPNGPDGNPKRCKSCDSVRHMLQDCPDSWENMKQEAYVTNLDTVGENEEGSEANEDTEVNECWLTEDQQELRRFCIEAKNCAALDSCCTGVVCGSEWLQNFLASMDPVSRKKVDGPMATNSVFKFGNKGKLYSTAKYKLPIQIAGRNMEITTEVINSDIPMLLSKESMKSMGMVLNFINDTAQVGNRKINLSETSSGHYILPILRNHNEEIHISVQLPENKPELMKDVVKVHRQFAHPGKQSMIKLLKESENWNNKIAECVEEVYESCQICKKTKKAPPRPVVSLSMTQEFNEIVTIDLKSWNGRLILHIVDMFTRYSISCFVTNKKPDSIVDAMMQNWFCYFGYPKKAIFNDNGGEFIGEDMREMKSKLDVRDITTGAESPFQNGLCERNHAVIDSMLTRLVFDNKNTDVNVLLKWANMAKNSLYNVHGFSPNQLVFGSNPKLGNFADGTPSTLSPVTCELLNKHLLAMKSARQAFIKSESCEKIRRALAHKMRASEEQYVSGDEIYYKKDNSEIWQGPAKVIFQDGKVVFIRHGSVYVRASINKILKKGSELIESHTEKKIENAQVQTEKTQNEVLIEELGHEQESMVQSRPMENVAHVIHLRKDDKIEIKQPHTNSWEEVSIINRAVKLSSNRKDKNWFNVRTKDKDISVNLDEVPFKITSSEVNEVLFTEIIPRKEHNTDQCIAAKLKEIEKLNSFNSYEVVERKSNDTVLGHTWVLVKKDGQVRARLTAKGFQEEVKVRSDSPTIGKPTFRLMLALVAQEKWIIKTTDITSAFLQGDSIDRTILMKPPKEAALDDNKLWKLSKPLYGLNDASRKFYLKVTAILRNSGCHQSIYDPALFYYVKEGKLHGLVGTHVDDFIHAGSDIFEKTVMKKIYEQFVVGKTEEKEFRYTGFQVRQTSSGLRIDQHEYVEKMKVMDPDSKKNKMLPLSEAEMSMLRSNVGAAQWVARGTRPDIGFDAIDLSTKFNKACQEDLQRSAKLIRRLKGDKDNCYFTVPGLGPPEGWSMEVCTDASWGNHSDGVSSMSGHVILLVGKGGKSVPLTWESCKIQRVVNSTLAAEMLACKKGAEEAFFLKTLLEEITGSSFAIKINCWVDHKGAVQSINSTNSMIDKRLRIDTAAIRQMLERGEISTVSHCPGKDQLADCLTKRGADGSQLLKVTVNGSLV